MNEHLEVEEQIIGIFLSHKDAVKFWSQSAFGINYFDEGHRDILAGIIYALNNDVQLTRQTYKDFLLQYKKLTPEQVASQTSLYNRCLMHLPKKDDLPMLLEKVKLAYIRRKTAIGLNEYRSEKDRLGDLGANRALIEKLAALEADTTESKIGFLEIHKSYDVFMDALMFRKANPASRLTCGINEIDLTMNVGFKEGHLTIFCADVGSFKSTIMLNVALNIFKRTGENILFIPLEMPSSEILQKIVSRETRIPNTMIEHAHLLKDTQIQKIQEEMKKWTNLQNRFCIMEMGSRAKLSHIRREIEKRINYFQPRLVFIDYADNLIPDRRYNRSDLEMNDILEDMRQMGRSLNFGTVSAAQLARDSLKKQKEVEESKQQLGSTDIRGGQVMTANADTVYGQLRDPAQPNAKLKFFCIKSRHGQSVFKNGRNNTVLNVQADIGLIESDADLDRDLGNVDTDEAQMIVQPPNEDDPFNV